jgi:WD40 repeat protein
MSYARTFAIGLCLLLVTLSVPAQADVSVVCRENSHSIVEPFEPNFVYVVEVTNTGDSADLVFLSVGKPPKGWTVIGGGAIILDAGEVAYYKIIVEPTEEVRTIDGAECVLPVTVSTERDRKSTTIYLTTRVRYLGRFQDLPRDSAVCGKVYDSQTLEPIPGAEVRLHLWSPGQWERAETDATGSYRIHSLSYEYMRGVCENYSTRSPPWLYLEVHAPGYQSYYESEIKPPRGGTLRKDIYLNKRMMTASYKLSWEKALGFGVWKAPNSENWDYIALTTGEHDPPGIWATFGIFLYDLTGNLVWNHKTGTQLWGIDISRDGRYVAAGSMAPESKVYLYDRATGALWENKFEGADIREVKFSHDGRYLAVGVTSLKLYDVATKKLLWEYDVKEWVREITFAPDDSFILAGASNGYLYALNTENGSLRWKTFHGGLIPFILDISEDGSRIATGGKGHEVRMFDSNGNLLWTYPTEEVITDGRMSADGSRIVVGTVWGGVYCLDGGGNLLWRRNRGVGHNSVYMTKNGKYIALGSGAGARGIMLLDNEGTVLWQNDYGSVAYVAVSEDGSKIIAGYSDPDIIRLYTGGVGIDSDSDGMSDDWENQYGLNPKDPSDGNKDVDGDGYTNLQEYQAGTDPTSASSYPQEAYPTGINWRLIAGVTVMIVIILVFVMMKRMKMFGQQKRSGDTLRSTSAYTIPGCLGYP